MLKQQRPSFPMKLVAVYALPLVRKVVAVLQHLPYILWLVPHTNPLLLKLQFLFLVPQLPVTSAALRPLLQKKLLLVLLIAVVHLPILPTMFMLKLPPANTSNLLLPNALSIKTTA